MLNVIENSSSMEKNGRDTLLEALTSRRIPDAELLENLGLFVKRQSWCRYLFMLEIYRQILDVHGGVMEFGVRWGQNMALFAAFRGIFEPYNYNRKVIGFDTFAGFPDVHAKDGTASVIRPGGYAVAEGYEQTLETMLSAHESQSPIPHIRKFEILKGDVTETLDAYLDRHPETIIALTYFDLDLYRPTRHCLERIMPLVPKGGVIAFDELNCADFPGESLALKEVAEISKLRIRRLPYSPLTSYIVVE
ncbi:MAG: TylF/MycF/NovP-related O-methyltransferase [Rhodospirillales bacterium]